MNKHLEQALHLEVPLSLAGLRLDQCLAKLVEHASRTQIQGWIANQLVTVDGHYGKSRYRVAGGEIVLIDAAVADEQRSNPDWTAEPGRPPHAVFEDEDIIVIDKPAGLVVHPGAGTPNGTLANHLLAQYPELSALPRAGIVHRLDKDTTGLMVVARSQQAHLRLVTAIAAREVSREYEAVVHGKLEQAGSIDAPIARDPKMRTRMTVRPNGRAAVTHHRTLAVLSDRTHLRLRLQTGRTHQIRVHLKHIGFPLVGDPVYGTRRVIQGQGPPIARQALHAVTLAFDHPGHGAMVRFDSELPSDIKRLLSEQPSMTSDSRT